MRLKGLVIACGFIAAVAFGGEKDSAPPLEFRGVAQVPGMSKDSLFGVIEEWAALTFGSSNEVIKYKNPQRGRIIGKANFEYEPVVFMGSDGIRGYVNYTFIVDVKDGRYRYEFRDFRHEGKSAWGSVGFLTSAPSIPEGLKKQQNQKTWTDLQEKAKTESGLLEATLWAAIGEAKKDTANW